MGIPTVQANPADLHNFVKFVFAHERHLTEFGAIKIQISSECLLALKKRKISPTCTSTQQITKVGDDELIYSVKKSENVNMYAKEQSPITNEDTFWSSLSGSVSKYHRSSVSVLPNKTFFYEKWHGKYFTIHSVPRQSLLKLGGRKFVDQFVSCLSRAHGPGAVFPLASNQQGLFSLVYHHEGGAYHWYIIPAYEREALRKIFSQQRSSNCLEHEELLIDPVVLDRHHIRYHRLVQYPNEIVVLAASALAQGFTEDASWSESIAFALPSWIEEGHATAHESSCRCDTSVVSLPKTIDISSFKHKLIQKYIGTHLNIINDDNTTVSKG
jgi:hypothetical protein